MQAEVTEPKFDFEFIAPFSTFDTDGKPKPVPYVVDGLLTQGGFSVLGAKPKHGKSSLARHLAVCVAKGAPFLGRETEKGGAIIVNLEDPRNHVDTCLAALQYDPATDAPIEIVERTAPQLNDAIAALERALAYKADTRLIVIDTLPKFIKVRDMNEYVPVMEAMERLRQSARSHPRLHIIALAHAKKVRTEDPFDGLLGSTALRGEPDTTLTIFQGAGQYVITSETRIGRNLPPSILKATVEEVGGANVVTHFSLGETFDEWSVEKSDRGKKRSKVDYELRIVAFLKEHPSGAARHTELMDGVEGKTMQKLEAIHRLRDDGVVSITGDKGTKDNPVMVRLNYEVLPGWTMRTKYGGNN